MVDKSEKKRLTKQYTALTKKIGRVLKRFTPIDPTDEDSIGDEYEDALPMIVSILIRGGNAAELCDILTKTRSQFGVSPDPTKDLKIAETVLKSMHAKSKEPKAKPCFKLDIGDDVNAVMDFLERRVRSFGHHDNPGPGASIAITSIVLGFECSQSGWMAIVFDLRESSKPDGEWTLYLDKPNVCIERSSWWKAASANLRGSIEVVDRDGKRFDYPSAKAPLPEMIGDMLKNATLQFRDRGGFSTLPLAPACCFYIENYDGHYAWPEAGDAAAARLALVSAK